MLPVLGFVVRDRAAQISCDLSDSISYVEDDVEGEGKTDDSAGDGRERQGEREGEVDDQSETTLRPERSRKNWEKREMSECRRER